MPRIKKQPVTVSNTVPNTEAAEVKSEVESEGKTVKEVAALIDKIKELERRDVEKPPQHRYLWLN